MGSWKKKGHSSVPRAAQKMGSVPFPRRGRKIPPRHRVAGLARLRSRPIPCRCFADRRESFTGGWWLLMTHQLSLEQSGTFSASLDHRAETQSLPPQARILGPEPSWCAH